MSNCHGCKWLDHVKGQPLGSGYCCMVVRSSLQSEKCRKPDMVRCELFKEGDWKTRFQT